MSQSLNEVCQRYAHIPAVRFRQLNELIAVDISNRAGTATVLLQGAQLITFTPINQKPLIWNSPLAGFRRGASSRGGIPVCWPWFGDATRNPAAVSAGLAGDALPAHGFVRGLDWQISDITTHADDCTSITLSLLVTPSTHPSWPFAAYLQVTHVIGHQLATHWQIENRDTHAFTFSAALHTYFAISDIDAVRISGLAGTAYIDALDNWATKTQQGDIVINREVDRIYLQVPPRTVIHDKLWQRDVVVEAQGSRSAVVWNPWIEKSKRLSDFAADAYRDMLCIETANVMDDIVSLAPGQSHQTSVTITSKPRLP